MTVQEQQQILRGQFNNLLDLIPPAAYEALFRLLANLITSNDRKRALERAAKAAAAKTLLDTILRKTLGK